MTETIVKLLIRSHHPISNSASALFGEPVSVEGSECPGGTITITNPVIIELFQNAASLGSEIEIRCPECREVRRIVPELIDPNS